MIKGERFPTFGHHKKYGTITSKRLAPRPSCWRIGRFPPPGKSSCLVVLGMNSSRPVVFGCFLRCCFASMTTMGTYNLQFFRGCNPYFGGSKGTSYCTSNETRWSFGILPCTPPETNSESPWKKMILLVQMIHEFPFKMGVSKNNGTPKSSILIGFSIINHPFWGTPIFGNNQMVGHFILRWGKPTYYCFIAANDEMWRCAWALFSSRPVSTGWLNSKC